MSAVMGGIGNLFSNNPTGAATYQNNNAPNQALTDYANKTAADQNINGTTGVTNATNEVQNNAIQGAMFGQGGLQQQLQQQGNNLANHGFSLQGQDQEAMGQASDNIARQYGAQNAQATEGLQARGLASGGSGAAGATFSGLQGNQNQQLAQAQSQIAQNRMNMAQQQLQANQQLQAQVGQQGTNAINSQYGNQLAGNQQGFNQLSGAAGNQNTVNQLNNQQQEETNQNAGKNIGDALSQGLFSSGQQIGASPGTGASSFSSSMGSSLGSGGGMMSDENNKENIKDGSVDIRGFLDSLSSKKYTYKPEAKGLFGAGDGEHYSPMAQDLEKTHVGASMVKDTPDGKMVDYGKGFGALASGLGDVNKRLKNLENK